MQADLVAGLTVGVMTVPEALSYARIAGLPSQYGLYGAFMPVLAYAIFGSSRQLVRACHRLPPGPGGRPPLCSRQLLAPPPVPHRPPA